MSEPFWLIPFTSRCVRRWAQRELALLIVSTRSAKFAKRLTYGCILTAPMLAVPSSARSSGLGWKESKKPIQLLSTRPSGWWYTLIAQLCGELYAEWLSNFLLTVINRLRVIARCWSDYKVSFLLMLHAEFTQFPDKYLRAKSIILQRPFKFLAPFPFLCNLSIDPHITQSWRQLEILSTSRCSAPATY